MVKGLKMSPANEKIQNIKINENYKGLILLGFYSFYFYLFSQIFEKGGQKGGQKRTAETVLDQI